MTLLPWSQVNSTANLVAMCEHRGEDLGEAVLHPQRIRKDCHDNKHANYETEPERGENIRVARRNEDVSRKLAFSLIELKTV